MITHKIDDDGEVSLWEDDRLLAELTRSSAKELTLRFYPDDAEVVYSDIDTGSSGLPIFTSTTADIRTDKMDFERTKVLMTKVIDVLNSNDMEVSATQDVGGGGSDWLRINVEQELADGKIAKAYFHFELKDSGVDYIVKEEEATG